MASKTIDQGEVFLGTRIKSTKNQVQNLDHIADNVLKRSKSPSSDRSNLSAEVNIFGDANNIANITNFADAKEMKPQSIGRVLSLPIQDANERVSSTDKVLADDVRKLNVFKKILLAMANIIKKKPDNAQVHELLGELFQHFVGYAKVLSPAKA